GTPIFHTHARVRWTSIQRFTTSVSTLASIYTSILSTWVSSTNTESWQLACPLPPQAFCTLSARLASQLRAQGLHLVQYINDFGFIESPLRPSTIHPSPPTCSEKQTCRIGCSSEVMSQIYSQN